MKITTLIPYGDIYTMVWYRLPFTSKCVHKYGCHKTAKPFWMKVVALS